MNDDQKCSLNPVEPHSETLTVGKAWSLLWDSAWEALILAFLIQILGGIAFAIVGNIWEQMTPSLPPVLASEPKLEASPKAPPTFHLSTRERFGLIFAVVFAGTALGRLIKYSRNAGHRFAADVSGRVMKRVSEEWFHLVVINALIASIMVSVLHLTSQYTVSKMLWGFVAGGVQPLIQVLLYLLPQALADLIKTLFGWYDANQLKFSFWLLYSAAICDDLGFPNYKALGRWLWRRLKRSRKSSGAKEAGAGATGEKQL
jgi:hypothetical protein